VLGFKYFSQEMIGILMEGIEQSELRGRNALLQDLESAIEV
jgi:hypothetical protein